MTKANIPDPHNLVRFVAAQESVYEIAAAELRVGKKTGHYMWFIFPQLHGLGFSETANYYSIKSLDEARYYIRHPILGTRITECSKLVTGNTVPVADIFGRLDALKFRSSMTLFECASEPGSVFALALDTCCKGQRDLKTLTLLEN